MSSISSSLGSGPRLNGTNSPMAAPRSTSPRDQVGLPPARIVQAPVPGVRSATASDTALGQKIRSLRRSRVLTQKELAAMVGVTGAQLHRYETGGTRIAASRLVALAKALGVRADSLIGSCTTEPEQPLAAPPQGSAGSGDDLLELIQIFSCLSDPRHRAAVLSIARMFPRNEAPRTQDEA